MNSIMILSDATIPLAGSDDGWAFVTGVPFGKDFPTPSFCEITPPGKSAALNN
jgi:hypothetical protein